MSASETYSVEMTFVFGDSRWAVNTIRPVYEDRRSLPGSAGSLVNTGVSSSLPPLSNSQRNLTRVGASLLLSSCTSRRFGSRPTDGVRADSTSRYGRRGVLRPGVGG